MKLSDPQTQILAAATAHPLRLAVAPAKLPVAAREAVRKSLLAKGLIEAVAVDAAGEHETWVWTSARTGPLSVWVPTERYCLTCIGEWDPRADGGSDSVPIHS